MHKLADVVVVMTVEAEAVTTAEVVVVMTTEVVAVTTETTVVEIATTIIIEVQVQIRDKHLT
jgi:CBS domain-containing protein